jgi:predicted membrane protein
VGISDMNLKGTLMWPAVGIFMLLCFLIIGYLLGTKYGAKFLAEGKT